MKLYYKWQFIQIQIYTFAQSDQAAKVIYGNNSIRTVRTYTYHRIDAHVSDAIFSNST